MIQYTINRFTTTESPSEEEVKQVRRGHLSIQDIDIQTTRRGDDSLAIWFVSDYKTEPPDVKIGKMKNGFSWKVGIDGYIEHPSQLNPETYEDEIGGLLTESDFDSLKQDYSNGNIERLNVWETSLTADYNQVNTDE